MLELTRRVGIAFASFALVWLAVSLAARWLFGSGNVLVWVVAAIVGVIVYLAVAQRERGAHDTR